MSVLATCLGYPRVGLNRELKKAVEGHWAKRTSSEALRATAADLRRRHWTAMRDAGLDQLPCNDFSLYDHMLDMAVAAGAVPARFTAISDPLARYFAMARGLQDRDAGVDLSALEMTKWFDTNYHYIVPELAADQSFRLDASKLLGELDEARALGADPRPVIPGPVTFLRLSKLAPEASTDLRPLDFLDALLPIYDELLALLAKHEVRWVQIDEPCLVLDLQAPEQDAYRRALARLAAVPHRPRLLVTTYFGALAENLPLVTESAVDGLHLDLVRAPEQLAQVLPHVRPETVLSVGVVDGRNIWRTDLDNAHAMVHQAVSALGPDRVFVASSCSLLHVPLDLAAERSLDEELVSWLAFAHQKLAEIRAVADAARSPSPRGAAFDTARTALASRRHSARTRNPEVRQRTAAVDGAMRRRSSPFQARRAVQQRRFGLPMFPTTTIGSFPQTREVREARAAWRAKRLPDAEYDRFLKTETARSVQRQEALGLDVLVHGEFERSDMVEYFGERLDGFAFTEHGWVQSYGSRCVKPPILYGDVSRPRPMTVDWSRYAQSLTQKPMKGMLTGPVTILQWSFVRDDQARSQTCLQVALALRDEVRDLESASIAIIQVDEPAIREGLPLRQRDWQAYLDWAVDAFRVATSGVGDATQLHTHMCYSEFGDILDAVSAMDADVLSIETSRSKMELLHDFAAFRYPNDIGPGVYDIHSPRVPTVEEMVDLLERAAQVLPAAQLWVNPDCGLKTRGWKEVDAALGNMVMAARRMRERLPTKDVATAQS
ncbi:MAG: 5-methyltetrahydropteroyltriglutamate--homocysteine S-methyltransferase [Luteitalea sp.]|nr:5-methyltetrahydropteroyltriglutamate--homocysteine S-methyltransferase [Luteitalea sp.]